MPLDIFGSNPCILIFLSPSVSARELSLPVSLLCQPEAFAAMRGLGYDASPAKEILNGCECLPLIPCITGDSGDKVAKRHGRDFREWFLRFGV